MKKTIIFIIVLGLLGAGAYYYYQNHYRPNTPEGKIEIKQNKFKDELKKLGLAFDAATFQKCAKDGNIEHVKLFIDAGMDVNIKGDKGWTALMAASLNCNTEVVKLLLEHKADVNVKDDTGKTALSVTGLLSVTAKEEVKEEVKELLKNAGAKE